MNISAYRGLNNYQPVNSNLFAADNNRLNNPAVSNLQQNHELSNAEIRSAKQVGTIECSTCEQRKYQDKSNDTGVSFKAPGHISPEASASAVMSHEQEHVGNEAAKAAGENRKVISQSVTLKTSSCPECGRVYVSGGETRTVTKAEGKDDYFSNNYNKLMNKHFGAKLDVRV